MFTAGDVTLRTRAGRSGAAVGAALLGMLLLLPRPSAAAGGKPLWEAGFAIAPLHLPDYPGSDQSRNYVFPLPYFIYRGSFLRVGRDGVHGRFVHSDRLRLDLSLAASVPVSSQDNVARTGMPNLRPMIGAGPSLSIRLLGRWSGPILLHLDLSSRAMFALGSGQARYSGWVYSPLLAVDSRFGTRRDWRASIGAGPLYADHRYNSYYYSVPAVYATATRPAYSAGGGYSGTQIIATLSHATGPAWYGAFVQYQSLGGATFAASPLVRQSHSVMAGFALAWRVWASSTTVP